MLTRRFIFSLLITAGVSALVAGVLPAFQYGLAGPIEKVEIDTRRKLAEYERSQDPVPLHRWVMSQDAAFYTDALYTLSDWATHHQAEFVGFLESMDAAEGTEFAEGFAFVLADTGRKDEFRQAFQNYRSPKIVAVLGAIPELVSWPQPSRENGTPID